MFLIDNFNHKDPKQSWLKNMLTDDIYNIRFELSSEK